MTYCFFSAQFLPTVGGVENHTFRLAEQVVQHGGRALVVTSALPGLPAQEVLEGGIEVYRLPSWQLGGGRLPFLQPGGEVGRVFRLLAAAGIDRAMIQTRLYPLCLAAARFCKKQGIPAMVVEHGHAYTATGHVLPDILLKAYTSVMLRLVHRFCANFYGVSQGSADWLLSKGILVKGLFYNAISLEAVRQALENPTRHFRQEYGLPAGALAVSYTGRLTPAKGIAELTDAVKRWAGPQELHLFVAGEGEEERLLLQTPHPRVHVLGRLPFVEVCQLLHESNWFCLPTALPEGLPSSALEAGACGTCVVGTALGGMKEIVPSGEYGLLLADNRPETLLAAFEKLAADEMWRSQMAARLQARVEERFTYDALYERMQNLPWGTDV